MASKKVRKTTGMLLVAPIIGAFLLCVLILNVFIPALSIAHDNESLDREARLVSTALVQALGLRADRQAAGLTQDAVSGRPGVLLFDALGAPIGAPTAPAAALQPMVGALTGSGAQSSRGVIWVRGEPQLAVAERLPDDAGAAAAARLMPLGPAVLDRFGAGLGLTNVRLSPGHEKRSYSRNTVTIALDASQGSLSWESAPVGLALARRFRMFTTIATLLLLVVGWWLSRRTMTLAQSLVLSEAHAKHLALHDLLTGLANRALFGNRLSLAIDQRRRDGGLVAVFEIDLDHFKKVNDLFGHQAGDELIREAGRRLASISRATDTVARLGGDEFAIVMPAVPNEAVARALGGRILTELSGLIALPGGQAELRASVGLTIIQDSNVDEVEAMRQADLALYRAKDEGRGRLAYYEAGMDESLRLRRQAEADLRVALADGGLTVQYQPQFTARGGKLESLEVLVRWNHPERGMLSPAYFIPVAEESGLIHDLGAFVLRRACQDARRWPHLTLAVNISPVQLRSSELVAQVRSILAETGADPSKIELEITEGVLLENNEITQTSLRELREMGLSLALDDFGTGYSSLSYLNLYPVSKIKIDQSFISNLGTGPEADKLVGAIIRLGQALGLRVTAEGVETELQRDHLAAAGCNLLQGYLQARPTDADSIDQLVAEQKLGSRAA